MQYNFLHLFYTEMWNECKEASENNIIFAFIPYRDVE
jgi:hypothetical protein